LKKPQISNSSLHFCENVFKKSRNFYKSLTFIIKSFHFAENVLKEPQNLSKSLTLLEKVTDHFEKASILLKMCLKSLVVFERPLINLKKPQFHGYLKMPRKK
jgi:hypothetical protein